MDENASHMSSEHFVLKTHVSVIVLGFQYTRCGLPVDVNCDTTTPSGSSCRSRITADS